MDVFKEYYPAKRQVWTQELLDSLDQVYRSNPYPSRLEYNTISEDLKLETDRVKTWFNNRRRRDFKAKKLCRQCRFFKAPIDEKSHMLGNYKLRPCIQYWSLPTVAPPPINEIASTSASNISNSSSSTIEDGNEHDSGNEQVEQQIKFEMNEQTIYSSANAEAAVPLAASLTAQPGPYNFQQPLFNPEQTAWYHQSTTGHYPALNVSTGTSWMMRPVVPPTYWPLPFNFTQSTDVQQTQFDHSSDWRSTHVNHRQYVSYAVPHETYNPYVKQEQPVDVYNHYNGFEDGPSSNY